MQVRRVAVLMNKAYFMAGVLSIVREHPDLEVLGFPVDDADLGNKLASFGPQVVVLDEGSDHEIAQRMFHYVLHRHPAATVVTVNSKENRVCAYRQRRVVGAGGADLLRIITSSDRRRAGPPAGGKAM
ncbi:MAG: hypothetical protein HYY01_01495 [Chloroflexi bacterium]|nr:hypothetical protein [Chloroflexota bacterium]